MTTFLAEDFRKLLDRLDQVDQTEDDKKVEKKNEVKTGNQKLTETKKKV